MNKIYCIKYLNDRKSIMYFILAQLYSRDLISIDNVCQVFYIFVM